jgi:hypothetical protein
MTKPGKKLDQKVLVSASKSRMLLINFKVTKETRFSNTELESLFKKEILQSAILSVLANQDVSSKLDTTA